MNRAQLAADLDVIFDTLDAVEIAYGAESTRGFPEDAEAEARLPGYAHESATRRLHERALILRRGVLRALEALPRPEGATVLVDGRPYRVLDAARLDDGMLLRLAVVPL